MLTTVAAKVYIYIYMYSHRRFPYSTYDPHTVYDMYGAAELYSLFSHFKLRSAGASGSIADQSISACLFRRALVRGWLYFPRHTDCLNWLACWHVNAYKVQEYIHIPIPSYFSDTVCHYESVKIICKDHVHSVHLAVPVVCHSQTNEYERFRCKTL